VSLQSIEKKELADPYDDVAGVALLPRLFGNYSF